MSEAGYWESYDKAKRDALRMAAKLTARERGTLVNAVKFDCANAVAHDQAQADRRRARHSAGNLRQALHPHLPDARPPARIGIPDAVRAADKIFFSPENKGRNRDSGFFHVHAEGEILT